MAAAMLAKSARVQGVATRASRRQVTVRAAATRPTWYPGADPPPHLDGSLVGDYGFDPLRLGTNPEVLKYYREGELTNGRWAMAATVGILFTDLVGVEPKFWEAGTKEYALDTPALLAIEIPLFALLEYKRYEAYKKTGETGVLGFTPFDPLGMKSEETKLKELKNGRLAMISLVGYSSQAAVTGLGPVEALKLHLEDPGKNNIFTSAVGKEATVAVIALAITPMIIDMSKNVGTGKEPVGFPWMSK